MITLLLSSLPTLLVAAWGTSLPPSLPALDAPWPLREPGFWQGIGGIAAAASATFAALSLRSNTRELRRARYLESLKFVADELNGVAEGRAIVRTIGVNYDNDVLRYFASKPSNEDVQKLLGFIYVLNRVAAGIFSGAIVEEAIFNVWSPIWFRQTYRRFEPFIAQERARRPSNGTDAYSALEWLANTRCDELEKKYPDARLRPPASPPAR